MNLQYCGAAEANKQFDRVRNKPSQTSWHQISNENWSLPLGRFLRQHSQPWLLVHGIPTFFWSVVVAQLVPIVLKNTCMSIIQQSIEVHFSSLFIWSTVNQPFNTSCESSFRSSIILVTLRTNMSCKSKELRLNDCIVACRDEYTIFQGM